jgi:hypothetical protein
LQLTTAQTSINKEIRESIIANWNFKANKQLQNDLLDDEMTTNASDFKVTLRIPWKLNSGVNHMLINGVIQFVEANEKITLSLSCSILKPLIIFGFLGFLSAFIFLLPFYVIPFVNLFTPILGGFVISTIYFGLFYRNLQKVSNQFITELKHKNKVF